MNAIPQGDKPRIVVVGGGISGLALAYALLEQSRLHAKPVEIMLLEQSSRLGGNLITEKHDGFLLDAGPDSWVASKPAATELARRLGLENELITPLESSRQVYVAWKNKLHPFPEGTVLGIPTRILPVATSSLFSWQGKLRMAIEPWIKPRHWYNGDDESIGAFVKRRLGQEAVERLAGPLLSGILAGNAEQLSLRATFPQLIEAEAQYGSLVRAMRKKQRERKGKSGQLPPSPFLSLRRGMGSLIDALLRSLEPEVTLRKGTAVRSISLSSGEKQSYLVHLDNGEMLSADKLALALPAYAASKIVKELDAELAHALDAFTYTGVATVFFAFRREEVKHSLDGSGFLVPRAAKRSVLAATWVSSKWHGRVPAGKVLLRVFLGGAGGEKLLEQDDSALVACTRKELSELMGMQAEPIFTRVYRFSRASCQPEVGHFNRVAYLKTLLKRWQGMHLLGSGYDGIGLSDCIRQAEAVARALLESAPMK